jgi:8-oxo-dGTP diphosphatase
MDAMRRRFYNPSGREVHMRRKIRVVGAMIDKDGRYLITQRPPTASLPLLWEFPGGRVEPGETDATALARELREEMGIEVEVQDRVIHVEHAYASYDIDFCVYRCRLVSGPIQHLRVHAHRWVRPEELDQYEFPPADEKSIAKLLGL